MKYGVNKEILLITAGTVWIIAGANILRIGIVTWLNNSEGWMFKIGEATIVFLLFFVLIFKRLYYKHTQRIEQKKEQKNCPFSFFDVKKLDRHDLYDLYGHHHPQLPPVARKFYICLLHRTVHRTDPDRRTLHPLLVAEAQDESGVTGKHLYSNKI